MYTYICGNIINNNDERTHFFRKIYLSHFMQKGCERVVCEGWVGDWTDCNILTPCSSGHSSTLLHSAGLLNRGPEGPNPLLGASSHCLELQFELQLTDSNYGTGLYHCLTPTCCPWASQLHWIKPVHGQAYILISSIGCTCFLIDGWVEGQYVTVRKIVIRCLTVAAMRFFKLNKGFCIRLIWLRIFGNNIGGSLKGKYFIRFFQKEKPLKYEEFMRHTVFLIWCEHLNLSYIGI